MSLKYSLDSGTSEGFQREKTSVTDDPGCPRIRSRSADDLMPATFVV